MNKRYISLIIVLILTISTLPTLFGTENNDCYEGRLLQSVNETLQPGQSASYYPPGGIRDDCIYGLYISGRDLCESCGTNGFSGAQYYVIVKFKNNEESRLPTQGYYHSCTKDIIVPLEIPGSVWKEVESIQVINEEEISVCAISYTWNLYSLCPCKGKQVLYPKVDIEQFSVTGGSTIIRDGKILTNFNVIPGVQQTFIQVENRGFFTQNDVKVKVMGLPEGVSVAITPDTQKIKAHNLGTYQATFEVGPNVPSGTYKITMMAYSENGVFDTIQIDLIVP